MMIVDFIVTIPAMAFFWTPAELAFAVPLGVLAAAFINFWAARLGSRGALEVAKFNLEAERALAQDERLWAQRSLAYYEAIKALDSFVAILAIHSYHRQSTLEALPEMSARAQAVMNARPGLTLYGGRPITSVYGPILVEVEDFRRSAELTLPSLSKDLTTEAREGIMSKYLAKRNGLVDSCVTLIDAIRSELHESSETKGTEA